MIVRVPYVPENRKVCIRYNCVHTYTETLGLSMELNDDILVQTTPPQNIARVKRVKCFYASQSSLKDARESRIFCAYLHGMYDFTCLIRAIVCREIDLC